ERRPSLAENRRLHDGAEQVVLRREIAIERRLGAARSLEDRLYRGRGIAVAQKKLCCRIDDSREAAASSHRVRRDRSDHVAARRWNASGILDGFLRLLGNHSG